MTPALTRRRNAEANIAAQRQVRKNEECHQRQTCEHREHERDMPGAPDGFVGFEKNELIGGDADEANDEPDQIERCEQEEQAEFRRFCERRPAVGPHEGDAGERPGKDGDHIGDQHGHRLPGDHRVLASGQKCFALADEQDTRQTEIDEPQRDAEGAYENEYREALRGQDAGEHEGLNQPEHQRAARCGRAQK
jgi:hypothetical protein